MIPKKVHLAWITKDLFDCPLPIVQEGVVKMRDLSPDWEFIFYDDGEIDAYIKEKLPPEVYAKMANTHPVQKCDVWRLIKLYEEGGVYTDIDRFCDTSFDDLAKPETKWVLPTCRTYDFSHDFMMTEPGNPAFDIAIKLYMQRVMEGHTGVYFLGPQTYMHAVTLTLTGEMINTDPGPEAFQHIRQCADQVGFIELYEEDPPKHTIIHQNGALNLNWEQEKRRLYKHYNLKHWTGEW
jgi:hypothetical protein